MTSRSSATPRLMLTCWAGLLAASSLSGCMLFQGAQGNSTFVPPAKQRIQFSTGFVHPESQAIAYRDPSEYEQYLRFDDHNARAEAILSVANAPDTALDFSIYRLSSLNNGWAFNRQADRIQAQTAHQTCFSDRCYAYRLYQHRMGGDDRSCVAFARAWDRVVDDPRQRPGKALFGYYCAPAGKALTTTSAMRILRGIRVKATDIPQVYYGQDIPNDPGALATARKNDAAHAGNNNFPFEFSRYYHPSNSGSLFN